MSGDTPSPAPGGQLDGHLDDEAASDALDGALEPAAQAHLATCATCAAAVDRQRAARTAVAASPPPVDEARRESAVAAALAAFEPVAGAPGVDHPESLDARRARHRSPDSPAPSSTGRWLGIAAVVLLLVIAVPLLALTGDRGEDQTVAGSDGDASAASDAAVEEGMATLAAPSAAVDVGDLGGLERGADLRPVVDQALGPVDGDDPEGRAVAEPEQVSAPDAGVERCTEELRGELPELGQLVLEGTATFEGAPALVLGFDDLAGGRPTISMVVVAQADCELLVFQSYTRR